MVAITIQLEVGNGCCEEKKKSNNEEQEEVQKESHEEEGPTQEGQEGYEEEDQA